MMMLNNEDIVAATLVLAAKDNKLAKYHFISEI